VPFFEQNPLRKLAVVSGKAEVRIDLRGMAEEQARARLAEAIERGRRGGTASFSVHFDPARGDGRETLFLPVGRMLLEARRAGKIRRCLPLPDGDGYYFELAPST
jgi:hypothetical protein